MKLKVHFQKAKEFLARVDSRHYICVGLTLGSLLCSVCFPYAWGRLLESFRDIGTSFAYFFLESINNISEWFFGDVVHIDHGVTATVNGLPKYSGAALLPLEWVQFVANWKEYWRQWADIENFAAYLLSPRSRV